jgi:hypothetical protein
MKSARRHNIETLRQRARRALTAAGSSVAMRKRLTRATPENHGRLKLVARNGQYLSGRDSAIPKLTRRAIS